MDNNDYEFEDKIYLPSHDEINIKDYLTRYKNREFSDLDYQTSIYSVPNQFNKCGKKQAALAEEQIFRRLQGLQEDANLKGLWLTFFHSAVYAGNSFRNQRDGRLMIREHDFVVFAKFNRKLHVILMEVKSTTDINTKHAELEKTSDAKVIKNNKRSAQHQLRDHLEVLKGIIGVEPSDQNVQSYIMWPFLGSYTKDPRQQVIKRWKEDKDLHAFEDTLCDQKNFNKWFYDTILKKNGVDIKYFIALFNRFIILSCGVFVNEIHEGMIALLTQEQLQLLKHRQSSSEDAGPLVVHGAAGTGKTLLVLKKLEELYQNGRLNEENRALLICYWPGIRCDVDIKLEKLGIKKFVDTTRFYISMPDFLQHNKKKYRHVFMDEAEALCLAFDHQVIVNTFKSIYKCYHHGNCIDWNCQLSELDSSLDIQSHIRKHKTTCWGDLWFMVDINQASLFFPKHSPQMLKTPSITLSKVMRTTGYIFNVFKQFYSKPMPMLPDSLMANVNIPNIEIGHNINGPPIYWININDGIDEAVANVVIDLCSTKGFKPNDICVLPFLFNENVKPERINQHIDKHFVENGYRPRAVTDVENYLQNKALNDFLIAWALRVKGLEFKVVIMSIDDDDFDTKDSEDRKRAYIIASRCTCMLILISNQETREIMQLDLVSKTYPFNVILNKNDYFNDTNIKTIC